MKENEFLTEEVEKEVKDINDQFVEFLHTKGISAKFKLAFHNIKESAKAQHEADVTKFNEVKKQSAEDNKEFVEFLHTKGFKAKVKLIIENIKKGAKESGEKTKVQIEASKNRTINVNDLEKEFNNFLKSKGLAKKYIVVIKEDEE